ncbi:MAG: hypothetical protein IJ660_07045 [Alphaproteobacteria bacterium]|nr:hypothetical protein [Alphaproteobacteria bacterium]
MADKKTLNISQTQMPTEFITPTGKREPLNVKQLLPRARLNVYQEMLKDGKPLTDEQKEDFDNLKNQGESVDFKRNDKDLKKEKPADDDKDRKFFEEKDILEYLYQNWLLDGANWICNKTTKGLWWVADGTATWVWNTGKNATNAYKEGKKEGKEGKKLDNSMTRYAAALNKTSEDSRKRSYNIANAALAKFEERMDRFTHSFDADPNTRVVLTEEEVHSPDYQALLALGPQNAQQECRHAAEQKHTQITNLQAINYIATALTRAQAMQNNMNSETPDAPMTPEQFNAYVKRNAYLIAQKLDQSNNPIKSLEEMHKDVELANKTVNKSMDKGKYKNNKDKMFNSPIKNKALNRLNSFLGMDEQGNITNDTLTQQVTPAQNMYQSLIDAQSTEQELNIALQDQNNNERSLEARSVSLNARRRYLEKWRRMHNSNDNSQNNQGQHQVNGRGGEGR